jgi:ubiquinone/menaquinone biosynthesis C-methylase UbiE
VYHVADAADLPMLESGVFDAVVANMALMDILDAAAALREAARVLRPQGRLVASLSHPCFEVPNASAWVTERMDGRDTVWRKVRRYREVFVGTVPWDHPLEGWTTPAYHRPLSWYFRALRGAGFAVTALEEPEPTEEFLAATSTGTLILEIPLHCVIEAVATCTASRDP